MSADITPFRIEIPQADVDDLRQRLRQTRWPEPETVDDWSQGIPLAYTRELCDYWLNDYDWRRCEASLNELPPVPDRDRRARHPLPARALAAGGRDAAGHDARLARLDRGVPRRSSGRSPIRSRTAASPADAFHLVCPSLPGYGFSDKPSRTGWSTTRIADAWDELMPRLGYGRYGAQGGDWGAQVTTALGMRHAANLIGIHLNMPIVLPDPDTMSDLTEQEQGALAALKHYQDWDSGYSKQQSTRPQTIGYGLVDSPAGLCAWIVEKFWSWTDCDGDPANVLTRDEMLDNVMLYWLTAAGASSARMYWESFGQAAARPGRVRGRLLDLPEGDLPRLPPVGREAVRRPAVLERAG